MDQLPVIGITKEKVSCGGRRCACETLLTFCWVSCRKNKFNTDTQWRKFYQNNFIVIFPVLAFTR